MNHIFNYFLNISMGLIFSILAFGSFASASQSLYCSWGAKSPTELAQGLYTPYYTMQIDLLTNHPNETTLQLDITNYYDDRNFGVHKALWLESNNSTKALQSINKLMLGRYGLSGPSYKTLDLYLNENGKISFIIDGSKYDIWTCEIPSDYFENYSNQVENGCLSNWCYSK